MPRAQLKAPCGALNIETIDWNRVLFFAYCWPRCFAAFCLVQNGVQTAAVLALQRIAGHGAQNIQEGLLDLSLG